MKMRKDTMIYLVAAITALTLVFSIFSCGAKRESAYTKPDTAKEVDRAAVNEILKKADALYEKRSDQMSMKNAIMQYEKAVEMDPTNKDVLTRLAIACYWYPYAYLIDKDAQNEYFNKGAEYGERVMGLNPNFRACLDEGKKDYECLNTLGQEEIGGVYWVFACLGKWSNNKGFTTILKNKNKLKAIADWTAQTDPNYWWGGGDRVLGVYYAKAPSFAGGDLDKSKQHFEKSLEIAPDYFGTKVLMAEFYAYKKQDKGLFLSLLNDVVSKENDIIPGIEFEQSVDKKKAEDLLKKTGDMFK